MFYSLLTLFVPAAMATFTPNYPRGTELVQRNMGEVCVIPKRLDGGIYSARDLKVEMGLCNMEVHGTNANVAICGKISSTNPGIEFYRLPTGMSAVKLEEQNCQATKNQDPDDKLKKLAKYKLSTSCSYTPALLGYYHVSRFLGNINQVPVAVLRTLDIKRHLAVGNKTMSNLRAKGEANQIIGLTWGSLLKFLNQGARSPKKDVLMTDDAQQSYGALQENPTKEEKYSEMYNGGANQTIRAPNFRDKNPTYRLLKNIGPVSRSVSKTWSTASVQTLQQMQNVSDMIIMDTILSQEDRFGNIHYTMRYKYLENGEVKDKSSLNEEDVKTLKAVRIKDMMLKDNDCGVNRENHLKTSRLLAGISHVSPSTYHKLLKLNKYLTTEENALFFRRETMMTSEDLAKFKINVTYAVTTLQTACKQGRLQLDLDLDGHFGDKKLNSACE